MNNLSRTASITRKTTETSIRLDLNLDGTGVYQIQTGIGFFDHMLEQLAKHSGMDLTIQAEGDTHIDCHHLVEDVGIALGQGLFQCLQDKKGVARYGEAHLPMDEALCLAVVDLSGRPKLVFHAEFSRQTIQSFDTEMVAHFFESLCSHAMMTLHINLLYGSNVHHQIECIFKGVARAFKMAVAKTEGDSQILSTKGCL